jgi:hypothetical protein
MKAPRRRTWRPGDRFRFNRYREQDGILLEGVEFVIVGNGTQGIRFRSPIYDRPEDRDRRMARRDFYQGVARRLFVRV